MHELPLGSRTSVGKPLVNFLQVAPGEKMSAIVPVREFVEDQYVMTVSKLGTVKKTALSEYSRPRPSGIIGAGIADDDRIIAARLCGDDNDILIATKKGMAIRFKTRDVRAMGRPSVGVRGIRLDDDDEVVGMSVLESGATILSVTANGYGKRTRTEEYRIQGRGGRGIILIKTGARNGNVVAVRQVFDDDHIMIITDGGTLIRMNCSDIPVLGRNTMGVRLVRVGADERVQAVADLDKEEAEESEMSKPLEAAPEDAGEEEVDPPAETGDLTGDVEPEDGAE